jgi:hypothetical protein
MDTIVIVLVMAVSGIFLILIQIYFSILSLYKCQLELEKMIIHDIKMLANMAKQVEVNTKIIAALSNTYCTISTSKN